MVAYLKKVDKNPELLKERIFYNQITNANINETFKPKQFIQNGKTYSFPLLKHLQIGLVLLH